MHTLKPTVINLKKQQNHGYWQTESKVYMENERPRINSTILKENKVWGTKLLDFKTYYKGQLSRLCTVGERIDK